MTLFSFLRKIWKGRYYLCSCIDKALSDGNPYINDGIYSHAEGYYTAAYGDHAHAEGYNTNAYGENSHSEGRRCESNGEGSHTEGISTLTTNDGEHAEGTYNISHHDGLNGSHAEGNTVHSVGIGSSNDDRCNAVEIMRNGDVYIIGIGNFDGKNYSSALPIQQVIAHHTYLFETKVL